MIKIVHLSDLHFGMPRQETVWPSFCEYIRDEVRPHLVLVTGDIVDTPRKRLYRTARERLDQLRPLGEGTRYLGYRVCPGNHDRHFRGNAVGRLGEVLIPNSWVNAWFDNAFAGLIATPGQALPFTLNDDEADSSWEVCVLGLDSSASAKYSAQGFATDGDLKAIRDNQTTLAEADLVIFMIHHHLLPIAALEQKKQSAKGLFSPTNMLNAGSMLETLARSNVNLVLHGHEHQRAVARYRTLAERGAEIIIVGAGSATGADTWEYCHFSRASANLFELHANRSIHLREIKRNRANTNWETSPADPENQLLSSRAIREARFYRRTRPAATPTSHILKTVEFHPNRDITIRETAVTWVVENGHWTSTTRNSSGRPSAARLSFRWADGPPTEKVCQFVRDPTADHSYRLVLDDITDQPLRFAHGVDLTFKWFRGGILTSHDLQSLNLDAAGSYRRRGMEYAGALARNELVSLSLLVRIPEAFAPDEAQVKVFYEDLDGASHESVELRGAIRHYAVGIFSLEVDYPIKGYGYVLAWPPAQPTSPTEAALNFAATFRPEPRARALVDTFVAALGNEFRRDRSTVALYIPDGDSHTLTNVGMIAPEGLRPGGNPPGTLSLKQIESLHRWSWWGDIQLETIEPGQPVTDGAGFVAGERALAIIPIKQSGREGDPPWGLIRLGIHAEQVVRGGDPTQGIAPTPEAFDRGVIAVLNMIQSMR